jgi:putative FmdB family regulatory protein
MPTYEYRCRSCGHSFDIVQKMADAPLTHCPECGGELRKVFAPPAISFKGSGFYATDHGKKAKSSTSSDTSKKDSSPASKDGASSGGGESSPQESGSKESGSKDAGTKTTKKEESS